VAFVVFLSFELLVACGLVLIVRGAVILPLDGIEIESPVICSFYQAKG
jgi:hypothetical protein